MCPAVEVWGGSEAKPYWEQQTCGIGKDKDAVLYTCQSCHQGGAGRSVASILVQASFGVSAA